MSPVFMELLSLPEEADRSSALWVHIRLGQIRLDTLLILRELWSPVAASITNIKQINITTDVEQHNKHGRSGRVGSTSVI